MSDTLNGQPEINASPLASFEVQHPIKPRQPIREQPRFNDINFQSHAVETDLPNGGTYGAIMHAVGSCCGVVGSILPCFCPCIVPFREVEQGNVGLVTRFGKFYKISDPGLVRVTPITEKVQYVNTQIQVMEIPSQWCMTKDNVKVYLSSVVYYHVTSPFRALYDVNDYREALKERTITTLRLVSGSRTLQEIIERREEIAEAISEVIGEVVDTWGVKVESILIKDIGLNEELQQAFAQAAMSRRIGESKIITARAEVESAKLMRKAADILESKAAMQIRYLEAMQNMAKTANSKVVFMPSASAIENLAENIRGKISSAPAAENTLSAEDQHQAYNLISEAAQQDRALAQNLSAQEAYF